MNEALNNDLLDAANRGNKTLVTELISKEANMEVKNEQGQTPLLIATSKGHLEVVRTLIEAGCDLKAKDYSNQNALHKAILEGGSYAKDIVNELLDKKIVEYDLKDDQGKSPLDYAKEKWSDPKYPEDILERIFNIKCQELLEKADFDTLSSDQDLVTYLIKTGSPQILDLINRGFEINVHATGVCYSKGPLYYAFREGHKDLFKKLIDLGANIASLEIAENLPLNSNCPGLKVDCDILSILIERGVNINAQDEQGRSALYLALEYSHKLTAEALIKLGCDVNLPDQNGIYPLHKVMHANFDLVDKVFIIDLLIAHDAKVDVMDKQGKNPLHKSMEVYYIPPEGKINILDRLLAKGVDINDRDCHGQTAFRKALDVYLNAENRFQHENDLDVLDALLINGADINVSDNNGKTLDEIICDAPVSRWLWGLLQHVLNKAKVNNPNHLGQNLFHIAAKHGNVSAETLKNLLKKYPESFSCRDNEGRTPLHLVIETGNIEKALTLLEKFPDAVHICDNHGCIPLHYICHGGRDMVQLLTKYKSNIDTRDKYAQTPADKAAADFKLDGLEELLDKGATFRMKKESIYSGKLLYYAIENSYILTALCLIKDDFDLHQENREGLNSLSLAIENNQTRIALALLDKDQLTLPHLVSKGKVPLDYAIKKNNLKVISKLMDLGVSIDFDRFDKLMKIINKKKYVEFIHIMIKLLDPQTNVVAMDYRVYEEALKQVHEKIDKFKEQKKDYSQLENLRDIIKSLKNIIKVSDYFVFFNKNQELLALCQKVLPWIEAEYSSLSASHYEHLLSKSDPNGLDRYKLEKLPDHKIIKNIVEYLEYEGPKLLEVSKAGVNTVSLMIQTNPIKIEDISIHSDVQGAGALTEIEV